MKKLSTAIIIVLVLFSSVAATMAYELKNSTAEVETEQGLCIFVDSKPVKEYKYLGTSGLKVVWTGKYSEVKGLLIKKIKKEFPEADGIIIRPSLNEGNADAIKFIE